MISREEVLKIASLSKLNLTEEEITKYQTDLNSILDYTKVLDEIDISNINPSATTSDETNVFRKDEVKESLTRQEVLSNAKDKDYGCFFVKKVVE